MNTPASLTKRSATLVKGVTAPVTTLQEGLNRAWAQYIATIKRAETDYFERVRRVTATAMGVTMPQVSVPVTAPESSDIVEPVTASTAG